MFKATSENAIRRDREAALRAQKSTARMDFRKQASDLSHERNQLLDELREHQIFLAKRKQDKALIQNGMSHSRRPMHASSLIKWERDRNARIGRMRQIELRLAEIRSEIRDNNIKGAEQYSYGDAFYLCAKEILPTEILSRLHTAAIAYLANLNRDVPKDD